MSRRALIDAVAERLAGRRVVWAGVRGEDAESLTDVPGFDSVFSIIGRYHRRPNLAALAYEDLTGQRVDLERWDIDDHLDDPATVEFRRGLLRRLAGPSALITYRPSRFLSAVWFARRDRCLSLGMFGGHQQAFEHKPWVEHELSERGIRTLPWAYVADEEQVRTLDWLDQGPVILRRSRTSGGEGIVRVNDRASLAEHWFDTPEAFLSVSPFLEGGVPVNVGATVWESGTVTVHLPSVQLIGIPELGPRPFGYCGNDFQAGAELEPKVIDELETMTTAVGRWLRSKGYLGTFGIDVLVHKGRVLFTEINPRFQGSTALSSRISVERDEACLLVEHLAAHLGVRPPTLPPLRERLSEPPQAANVVLHSTLPVAATIDARPLARALTLAAAGHDSIVAPDIVAEPGATVLRFVTSQRVTTTGFDLLPPFRDTIRSWWATQHVDHYTQG